VFYITGGVNASVSAIIVSVGCVGNGYPVTSNSALPMVSGKENIFNVERRLVRSANVIIKNLHVNGGVDWCGDLIVDRINSLLEMFNKD
jgi:hypothetical protein